MPITPSFPGIYIEELPNLARTVTAAPTSIAVFVGYSHPFKTKTQNFGKAVQIFSFTEYEREFGGLFRNDRLDSNLPYAVQQFFLNGGSNAYVVALKPQFYTTAGAFSADFNPATVDVGGIRFTAQEPTDANFPMRVTVRRTPGNTTIADITITYGAQAETFRQVSLTGVAERLSLSTLVTVSPVSGTTFGSSFTEANAVELVYSPAPNPSLTTFSALDFVQVFDTDGSLDKVDIFNLLVLPGVADSGIWGHALAFCERKRAFLILDPPPDASADGSEPGTTAIATKMTDGTVPSSTNGALYFPYLTSVDVLTGKATSLPPSGYVAGIYARTDTNRGVWKAPAGLETTILNATGVVPEGKLTDLRAGVLNNNAVNALRSFPGVGTVVFGARTLVGGAANVAFQQWRYVPVRRMALFIEQTLYRNLGWAVFEPNDAPLWLALRTSVEAFMLSLFRQGAFQGSTPSQAFLVKCDDTTTTQTDIDNGVVNILVGFRPLKPAEFVFVKISQLAGQVQS